MGGLIGLVIILIIVFVLASTVLGLIWDLAILLIIGGLIGWAAGNLTKGSGYGLVNNILLGIVGSFVGGLVLGLFGLDIGGLIGRIIAGIVGAVLLIVIGRALRGQRLVR